MLNIVRNACSQLCLEFTVSESLTLAFEMKDGACVDAVAAGDGGLPDTVQSGYRKSSLPAQGTQTSKPPVPVFRKRTSAGNCLIADGAGAAIVHDQSAVSGLLPDVVDSTKPVKSSVTAADTTTSAVTVSDDLSTVSQQQRRQHVTATPSLMSAVLATSAASIAMITIQGPSPKHSPSLQQNNGNHVLHSSDLRKVSE